MSKAKAKATDTTDMADITEMQKKLREQEELINQMSKHIIKKDGYNPFDKTSICQCGKKVESQYIKKCTNCLNRLTCGQCALIFCDRCNSYICDKEDDVDPKKLICPSCIEKYKVIRKKKLEKNHAIYRKELEEASSEQYNCKECGNEEEDKLSTCDNCDYRVCRFHNNHYGSDTYQYGEPYLCVVCDVEERYKKQLLEDDYDDYDDYDDDDYANNNDNNNDYYQQNAPSGSLHSIFNICFFL